MKDHNGDRGRVRNRSGYILKAGPTEFAHRGYKGHEKEGLKKESSFWPEQLEGLSAIAEVK